ncbi:MAG: carbohydrate kinase family protein [Anaerolineaceae bacterium]|nr:carbohydrate kinase family protein [Anaerolineaceae bacterium]
MAKILVAGLINIETTARIDHFPVDYMSVRYPFFGVRTTVSGVGFNVAKALTLLGHEVRFLAMIGQDEAATFVRHALKQNGIAQDFVLSQLPETPQSVILYDGDGRRMINVDLKDIQETTYPFATYEQAIAGVDLAVLCNINFSRPLLAATRERGIPIATDVHTIDSLTDAYNRDYMSAANILLMSDERLPSPPIEWAQTVQQTFDNDIVAIGMGARGVALKLPDKPVQMFPAQQVRPVVNTIGAGDALFSSFLHGYLTSGDAERSMQAATLYAGHKIGESGAAKGLLDVAGFDRLVASHKA